MLTLLYFWWYESHDIIVATYNLVHIFQLYHSFTRNFNKNFISHRVNSQLERSLSLCIVFWLNPNREHTRIYMVGYLFTQIQRIFCLAQKWRSLIGWGRLMKSEPAWATFCKTIFIHFVESDSSERISERKDGENRQGQEVDSF